jgi:hypothetical protein
LRPQTPQFVCCGTPSRSRESTCALPAGDLVLVLGQQSTAFVICTRHGSVMRGSYAASRVRKEKESRLRGRVPSPLVGAAPESMQVQDHASQREGESSDWPSDMTSWPTPNRQGTLGDLLGCDRFGHLVMVMASFRTTPNALAAVEYGDELTESVLRKTSARNSLRQAARCPCRRCSSRSSIQNFIGY